jgi:hypothetical protein
MGFISTGSVNTVVEVDGFKYESVYIEGASCYEQKCTIIRLVDGEIIKSYKYIFDGF